MKREIYKFIRGFRRTKPIFLLSLPMIIYAVHRYFHHVKPMNKIIFVPICILFIISAALFIRNIAETARLKARLDKIYSTEEYKILESDYQSGSMYLDRNLIIGRKYIFSKHSARLFSFDELSGVFDDIRDTYNVLTMAIAGADDIVKTKIIKAEYKNKNFLHDRRICEIEVHKTYLSDVGETNGYEQLCLAEEEMRNKINGYKEIIVNE